MTREEEIQKYADDLSQQYFPDECNIWARENIEAKFVSEACVRMAKYVEQELIKKACEWLKTNKDNYIIDIEGETIVDCSIIKAFRKAMEE